MEHETKAAHAQEARQQAWHDVEYMTGYRVPGWFTTEQAVIYANTYELELASRNY